MARKRLLLVGGGHAHLQVLESLAEEPVPDADVSLLSPFRSQFYSGMLPGFVGGDYSAGQAAIDLETLCARAGVRFQATPVTAIHADRAEVATADGELASFDLLSIDIGSVPRGLDLPGVSRFAIPIRPFENARRLTRRIDELSGDGSAAIAIVGAGAGGVEIALATRRRAGAEPTVLLIDPEGPLVSWPSRGRDRIESLLRERRIDLLAGRVAEVSSAGVHLEDGRTFATDLVVWATGPAPPPLIGASTGLPVSADGYIEVGPELGAIGRSGIWAAGDCADLVGSEVPKAGVFAVRQGPVLARNLRAAIQGRRSEEYRPQARYLSILNTADGRGLARWGPLVVHGRWTWRLKDWIDRRWIARFQRG